uniref:Uncharacterized mitochondrial protein AtMg00810-like n=1 Tax=Nicotiana tabacum TaxID=4097 RepID=A0A1S4D3E8_TOBAC|nr:PREDICTED: uncharacterized mitochondrial protein AtMg00810-like [Nicotiana tabacum]
MFQLDINNAFLYGDFDEEMYMKLPHGLVSSSASLPSSSLVGKLQKSLYRLRQASRQWYAKLSHALCSRGYSHSLNDYSFSVKKCGSSIVLIVVYVDGIILTGNDLDEISSLKAFLDSQFKIKDLGVLNYFLGIKVSYSFYGLLLHQKKFIRDLLHAYDCELVSPVVSPLDLSTKLKADYSDLLPSPESYRSLVGKLNFLTHTRPDLCFAVQHLSQFLQTPRFPHMRADCPDIRKSVTGFCIFLGGCLVGWKAKKQPVVSLSSTEAEYHVISKVVAELSWVARLLSDFGIPTTTVIPVFCDNQAAIHIAKNPVFHERTKHIEVDCHFIRTKFTEGPISLHHFHICTIG